MMLHSDIADLVDPGYFLVLKMVSMRDSKPFDFIYIMKELITIGFSINSHR